MNKKKRNLGNLVIFIIVILALLIIIFFLTKNTLPDEINEGEPAFDFCSEKCGDLNLLFSVNNSEYDFIKCECVLEKGEPRGYTQTVTLKTKVYYFDSETLESISEEEVSNRIR